MLLSVYYVGFFLGMERAVRGCYTSIYTLRVYPGRIGEVTTCVATTLPKAAPEICDPGGLSTRSRSLH
jgi:hypothetical protein